MASQQGIVDYIVEQSAQAGAVSSRKMFGEYAIFCDGKVVALVCDDQLFVKPTNAGRMFIGTPAEAPPYKGAKPYFLISGDQWDNADWLAELIKISTAELPFPKPKKPRRSSKS